MLEGSRVNCIISLGQTCVLRKGHPMYFLQLAPSFLVSSGKVRAWCLHRDRRGCGFETSPASMAERSNFFEGWWAFQVHWGTKYKGTDRHPIPTQSVLLLLPSALMFSFPEELNSLIDQVGHSGWNGE